MKKTSNFYQIWILFITFLKIGCFTFGGGYAMIPIIQREVSEKRKWITNREILEILAIAESTPGPIAINTATYVGYKVGGFFGGLFATIGLIVPSFIIIFVISLFYKTFMQWEVVSAMFKGIRVAVIILLFLAVVKLKKAIPNSFLSVILFAITLIGMLILTFLKISIPAMSMIFIAFGLSVGLIITICANRKGTK